MDDTYRITGPTIPPEDLSGPLGPRLLRLLTRLAERDLLWLERDCAGHDVSGHRYDCLFQGPPRYPGHPYALMHQVSGCALQFAVLALFGPHDQVEGHSRDDLRATALGLLRALCATHPVADPPAGCNIHWDHFDALRHDYVLGLALWLLWEDVDEPLRLLLARMLEHDANPWCGYPAPAQLYDDTQAESNAWSSSGMALAYCLLKRHPRRETWGEKAQELMISAYATEADVHSECVVDGRPLREWLTGPNAFPDHTVENHGIIHGDYLAAVSEQVRTAIVYRLAQEPIPEAVLFNAGRVFDRLMFLGLPDGSHLYMQGSDYIARRLDSFYQACNIAPLVPGSLRSAAFLRALDSLEEMERQRPQVPIGGWLGSAFDLGVHWGTMENYLMRRFFGPGEEPLLDDQVNSALAGVHVAEPARYAVHRTAATLSSFSWHTTANASQVMGLTMGLDRDVLVAPLPVGSMLGRVRMEGSAETVPQVVRHRADPKPEGLGIAVELSLCDGAITQHSAFVSLPDGASVYLEERIARRAVRIADAVCGNVAVFDDTRWPYQQTPRAYHGVSGVVDTDGDAVHDGTWVNVDDRPGLVTLGAGGFRLRLSTDYMASRYGDQYRLGLVSFLPAGPTECGAGDRISLFAIVTCPHQDSEETRVLAEELTQAGWVQDGDGTVGAQVGSRRVWANWETGEAGWTDVRS